MYHDTAAVTEVLASRHKASFCILSSVFFFFQIGLTVEVVELLTILQFERGQVAYYIFTDGNRYA
jgi:hypothetical protein